MAKKRKIGEIEAIPSSMVTGSDAPAEINTSDVEGPTKDPQFKTHLEPFDIQPIPSSQVEGVGEPGPADLMRDPSSLEPVEVAPIPSEQVEGFRGHQPSDVIDIEDTEPDTFTPPALDTDFLQKIPTSGESGAYKQYMQNREIASGPDAQIKELESRLGINSSNTKAQMNEEEKVKSLQAQADEMVKNLESVSTKDFGFVGDVASDVFKGIQPTSLVRAAAGGVLDAAQELANFGIDVADTVANIFGEDIPNDARLSFAKQIVPAGDSTTEGLLRGAVSFLVPFGAGMKVANRLVKTASAGGVLAKSMVVGGAVDFAAFDPNEARLSNFIENYPTLSNPVTQYLASKPGDSRAEGRFKNFVEGLGLGVISEAMFKAFRFYKGARTYKERGLKLNEVQKMVSEAPPVVTKGAEEGAAKVAAKPPKLPNIDDIPLLPGAEKFREIPVIESRGFVEFPPLPEEALAEAGGKDFGINISEFNSPQDFDKAIDTIKGLYNENPESFVQTHAETLKRAENLTFSDAFGKKVAPEDLPAVTVVRKVMAIKSMDDFKLKYNDYKAGKIAADDLNSAYQKMGFMLDAVKEGKTVSGRFLEAQKIQLKGQERIRAIDDLVKLNGGDAVFDRAFELLSEVDDKALAEAAKQTSLGRKLYDAAVEVRINGLLSGTKTQAFNIIGNTSAIVDRLAVKSIDRGLTMLKNTPGGTASGEVTAMIQGLWEGMGEGFDLAWQSFKSGKSSAGAKAAELNKRAISGEAFGVNGILGETLDVLGTVNSLPGRSLISTDEFFKAINYRMEFNALKHRKAIELSQLTNKPYSEILNQLNTAGPLQDIAIAEARESLSKRAGFQARENTFTKELTPYDPSLGKFQLATKTFTGINELPGARLVFPFIKTNLNIFEHGLERVPGIKRISTKVKADLAAGGARAQMQMAKSIFGGSIMAVGATAAYNGLVTGAGPANFAARRELEQLGWQPYSFKIGDTYVAYNRLDPLGNILGLAADMAELGGYAIADGHEGEFGEIAIASGMAVGNFMTPEFLTYTTAGIMSALSKEQSADKFIKTFISSFPQTMVPFSSLQREINRGIPGWNPAGLFDTAKRDVSGTSEDLISNIFEESINRIKANTPGLSKDLPPRRDLFGNVVHYNPGWADDIASPVSTKAPENVRKELIRLAMTGPIAKAQPSEGESHLSLDLPNRTFRDSRTGFARKMTPQEYDQYQLLSAGIGLKGVKKTLAETLSDEISNDYPSLPSRYKSDEGKRIIIKNIISNYRRAAMQQMFSTPDIRNEMRDAADKRKKALDISI